VPRLSSILLSTLALAACQAPAATVVEQPEAAPSVNVAWQAPEAAPPPEDAAVDASVAAAAGSCPEGMNLIQGGTTWMGTDFDVDEAPRHQVAVKSFCMDAMEVTAGDYHACAESGKCQPSHKGGGCTEYPKGKQDFSKHPVNCVDWEQADAACKTWGKRLPTEREWEFAASGGPEHRRFSWGSEDPEGRSCYNKPGTCAVGSFKPGAFGLHDMTGNVWEWTASWFGEYPAEAASGRFKVYRGGSYSRRYPRWMRNGLRNRFGPSEFGAHLGFRCAMDLAGSSCPSGSETTEKGCDIPGQKTAPKPTAWGAAPASGSAPAASAPEPAVLSRDARYDDDCLKYKPGRPICYLIKGGSFADRQKIGGGRGCVNRDVGIGYNSICCAN
jgi:formylglycine-generating enzyme required for sulfatase activity